MGEKTTRIILIRHGANDWLGKRFAGWLPGVHLNDIGRAQAQVLAERLAGIEIAAVYSSPLERAQETAEPIATTHGLQVVTCDDLGEIKIGDWSGQSLEELSKTDLWRQIQVYPSGTRFPNGETLMETQVRATGALDQIRQAHPGQTVVAVSHADVIKAVIAFYGGIHLDLFQRIVIDPASISEVMFTPFGPRLLRLNDCGQLPVQPETPEHPETEKAGADGQPEQTAT